jgi:hypothetical protein
MFAYLNKCSIFVKTKRNESKNNNRRNDRRGTGSLEKLAGEGN